MSHSSTDCASNLFAFTSNNRNKIYVQDNDRLHQSAFRTPYFRLSNGMKIGTITTREWHCSPGKGRFWEPNDICRVLEGFRCFTMDCSLCRRPKTSQKSQNIMFVRPVYLYAMIGHPWKKFCFVSQVLAEYPLKNVFLWHNSGLWNKAPLFQPNNNA
jgi:hypothetical protein